jgi:apolipoprotein N-acyltransferase
MPTPSVFHDYREQLERSEFQLGLTGGRVAVAMDILTDAMVMVGQHGVYCQSARQPGKPAMDIQIITQNIEQAKELLFSVLEEIRPRRQED